MLIRGAEFARVREAVKGGKDAENATAEEKRHEQAGGRSCLSRTSLAAG
jgi:hypothetical protein